MSENSSSSARDKIVARLRSAGKLLAIAHARPDGDALGCLAALVVSARAAGRSAEGLVPDGVPLQYKFLFDDLPPASGDRFSPLEASADTVVLLDTCTRAQLGTVAAGVVACRDKVIVMDHHATAEDIGAVQWIDPSAAATGVMLGEVLEALGWPVGARAAEALMTAITTDTGWLRFANTDARCLQAAARLVASGVRPDRLFRKLYQNERPQRLRLIARMLAGMELTCGGRLACMSIRNSDFDAAGAARDETENMINEALRIGTVETVVLVVENPDTVRVSLRSRDLVNVARVAERFGGGGHPRAAGIRITGDFEQIKRRVVIACAEALEEAIRSSASPKK